MTPPVREELAACLARAAARDGDLDAAAELLSGAESATALDLLARVHAQRGALADADRSWARVLELIPGDGAATAGRRAVAEITGGRRHARPAGSGGVLAACAAVLALVLVAGAVTWLALPARTERAPQAGGLPESPARSTAESRRADALQQRLNRIDADRAGAAQRRTRELDRIAAGTTVPGVTVVRRRGAVELRFESGIFVRGIEPRDRGVALLRELGARLAHLPGRITVVGHTVAVPGGPQRGGSTVALARAQVATRYLADGGDLPLTVFRLASGDQARPVYADAARNRTVTVVVRPEQV